MLRKLKWQLPGEPLAARYNWCQSPIPGRGPAVEKHWFRGFSELFRNHQFAVVPSVFWTELERHTHQ